MANQKVYTQAEVDAMLSAGTKPFKVEPKSGISKKTNKPYSGFQITGNFPPVYVSRTVALALAKPENWNALVSALR